MDNSIVIISGQTHEIIYCHNDMFSKYFARLTDVSFKKDSHGNTLFFPWGIYGKGRIITDEISERKIRNFIILYNQISLLTVIITIASFGCVWSLLLPPVFTGWFYFAMKSLLNGCPYSEEKIGFQESFAKSSKIFNKFTLWILLICSALFVIAGVVVILFAKSTGDLLIGINSIIFFGACAAVYVYILSLKKT